MQRPNLADRPALPRFEAYWEATDVVDVEKKDFRPGAEQLFLLRNVLSPLECRHYIEAIDELGLSAVQRREDDGARSRLVAESAGLAALLWDRCGRFMEDTVTGAGMSDNQAIQPLPMDGVWNATGLNDRFRASLFTEGAQVGPHYHSNFVRSGRERSWKTVMLCLSGDFEGGFINFFIDNGSIDLGDENSTAVSEGQNRIRIQPEVGMALVFNNQLMHEGEMVSKGFKYILTTDVMYRREGGPDMEPEDEEALLVFQSAQDAQVEGEMGVAASLYIRAFKMSRRLAEAFTKSAEQQT